jgi:hypothetical protein
MHTKSLSMLVVVAVLPGWFFTAAAATDIFKCSVRGQTTYQDRPCAGAAVGTVYKKGAASVDPGLGVPDHQPRPSTPGNSQLTTLQRDIRDAIAYSRQLQRLYDADVKMTRLRVASLSRTEQQLAVDALRAKWEPQLQAASQRERILVEEAHRLCPHGAVLNAQSQLCSR